MKKIMLLMIAALFTTAIFAQNPKVTEIKSSQLPKEATKWITDNISGGTITRAGKVDENGVTSYAAVVEQKGSKHAYLFDKNGKFTGKGDHLFKSGAAAKPAVANPAAKPATKAPATDAATPKK
jgi:hypothetical protein